MIKWLLLAVAAFVLYKLVTNDRGRNDKKDKNEQKIRDRKIASGEMVKDPICNVYVEAESALKVRDGEKTYCFCGYECREKFLEGLKAGGRELPDYEGKDEE
ncbi:MAG: transcriptional regulator [Desulfovibrio sp.]|jgi:YHS domain-containing protein|nr:transcriptional regulator [Desulfovibrio sp.]